MESLLSLTFQWENTSKKLLQVWSNYEFCICGFLFFIFLNKKKRSSWLNLVYQCIIASPGTSEQIGWHSTATWWPPSNGWLTLQGCFISERLAISWNDFKESHHLISYSHLLVSVIFEVEGCGLQGKGGRGRCAREIISYK